MILAFEMTWAGVAHAPINAAMLQVVGRALPAHTVRVHADPTHLRELAGDPALSAMPRLERVPVSPSRRYEFQTQIVSGRRFAREFAIIRCALRRVPRGEPVLLLLLSATPTAIWAAALAARLHGLGPTGVAGVHVALHGNLNEAIGWRPRNPLTRRFDLAETLQASAPGPLGVPTRFIVFETHIRDRMKDFAPEAARRTDVVPHPVSLGDIPEGANVYHPLSDPIRIGFVGQGTHAKGIDVFLDVAARVKARHPGRVAFHLIGSMRAAKDDTDAAAVLEEPPGLDAALTREIFVTRLARLHYVLLPFRTGYYDLSASGGLVDAVTWLKPVITTRVPLIQSFEAAYGDIGHLAPGNEALAAVVDAIVATPDATRYAAQAEAMRRARDSRTPAALAATYRMAVLAGFPAMRGDAAAKSAIMPLQQPAGRR